MDIQTCRLCLLYIRCWYLPLSVYLFHFLFVLLSFLCLHVCIIPSLTAYVSSLSPSIHHFSLSHLTFFSFSLSYFPYMPPLNISLSLTMSLIVTTITNDHTESFRYRPGLYYVFLIHSTSEIIIILEENDLKVEKIKIDPKTFTVSYPTV